MVALAWSSQRLRRRTSCPLALGTAHGSGYGRLVKRRFQAWALVLGITVAGGCGGDDDAALRARIDELERQVAATSTTAPTSSTSPVTSGPATSTLSAAPPTTVTPPGPKVAQANQGDRVFAVFVATGDTSRAPSFTAAQDRLKSLGYTDFAEGETGCSQGAKEALPQLKDMSLSVEFATRADADRFSALYGPVIGVAAVKVFCAD